MPLTERQKKWAIGGGVGAAALLIGYSLFRSRPAFAGPALPPARPDEKHEHQRRKHRKHDERDRGNDRGEYGRKKHHRKGHKHD